MGPPPPLPTWQGLSHCRSKWITGLEKATQTVQPFGYLKSGYFSMTDESLERWRSEMLAGCGTMLFQKMLKSCSEMLFLVFWLDKFCLKYSLQKSSVIFLVVNVCMTSRKNTWLYFIFLQCALLKLSGHQFQLSILCSRCSCWVYYIKRLNRIIKSGFFLPRSHIGQVSGFSRKIGRIPTRSGWLDSLATV